jgi:hypothetical protein
MLSYLMKYCAILLISIFVITSSIRTNNRQAVTSPSNNITANATQPNATQPAAAPFNATAGANITFADRENVTIASTVLPNIYLAADISNCTQADQQCGALEGYMENNPENRFTLRALANRQDAFCIGRGNAFIHFDPTNCTRNATNATMCALVGLINTTDCKEDNAFRLNRTGNNFSIESVKNPLVYLFFNVENCRGIMSSQPEANVTAGNNTAANATAVSGQQRCGRVEMWNIPNLAEMINTNESIRGALFDIIKENVGGAGNGRNIPSVPL